ncbi:zinc finger FYVE domain-containing protein 26-like [Watersipora subatra]|uniref:zinc finger FYVE domain-containing protein 26-like n=1 Tax=Watersipora subatra TaxID=2589382 RepID=UPI00355B49D8
MEFAELLAHKYHFGREHEASIQLLFRSFCNNLYIGQFELARASIKELHQQRSFLKYHVKDVFSKALDRWCTSENPLHPLTWPCFLEYKLIEDNATKVEEVTKALEFHFLLADVCQDAESSLIKDIYAFYAQETSELSSPCQAFLVSILVKKPTPATLLLDYLPLKNVTFQMNNVTLDAIDRCITEKNQSSLRELLARGKLELNVDGAKDRLEVILAKAFADCLLTGEDERWLSYEDIMTASASRSDLRIYTLAQTLHMDSLEESDKQAYKWRDMALNMLTSQTHFFDTLLTHSDKFMKEHRYQDLVAMFDTPEWRPLFPFVFHRAWRLCSNTEQSHQVIAAFSQVEDKKLAALINEHQRIDIIEQSLDLSSTTSRTPSSMKSGDLSVFKSHSVLHALYICLSNLDSWSHQKMMKTLTAESAYALLDQYELGMSGSNSLSIKQQRDIHLFNAFTIIDSFMQALCKASENISGVAFSQRYAGDVVPLLVTLRNLLVDLRPLTLKLEVIEDLFLLLFAMSQDIKTSSQHARADMAQSMGQEKSSYAEMSEDDPECYHSAREWVSTSKPTKHNSSRSKTDYLKVPKSKIQSSRTERSSDENPNTDGIQTTAVGFIANEFITRDILTIIKMALTDVTASSFEIRNNLVKKRLEDELRQVILSSISENNFMSRLSQLQQRVSEALWRYQLLLQDSVVKEFGSVTLRPTTDTGVHNDDGYGVFERSLPNMTASKSSLGVQRSGEASQESELSSEILTYSSGTNTPAALSKNKRYRKRMASQKSALSLPSMEGLIPKMLASPISLLNICINRGNDTQARQVLKLYNLEESVEGRQFSFAQSHKQFLLEQGKQQRSSKPVAKKSSTQPVENLSFMRSMAAKSLTTMDDSLKAETLALAATLPRTQGGLQVDKFLGANARDSQVATSMVLADLACANADCFQRSHHLLTTAWKYSTSSSRSTSGLQSWIKKCLSLNEFAVSLDLSKLLSLLLDEEMHSLQSCLLSTLFTMDTGELSEKIVSLMELCKEVKVVEQAIGHYLKIPAKERSQTLELTPVLRILSKHFPGSRQYLSILSDQLILLQKTIKDNALPPSGVAAVLYDGPTMTMGRLMFEHNIEPARLASVAEQVKLDLTHVIVRSCCPPVRCKPFEEDAHAIEGIQESLVADKKFGYRRVLNQSHVHAVDFFLPPLVTVSNALTSLLKLLNGTLVMNNKKRLDRCLAIKIKETEAYSLFCDECRQLQSVDLKLLTTNQQKLAFFINLHNMLSLHGVVETMVTQRRAQRMLDSMSTAAAFHMRVSYIVGQLGLCSVFELQQFFLRVNVVKHMDMCIDHPWACYAPEPNPLTVFALYDGRLNVLPLKCTSAETVDNEISDSVTMYMRRAVIISPHSLEVCWFDCDFHFCFV